MWIGIVSLFPEMFRAITEYGITGRAVKNGLLNLAFWNPRDFSHDKHRSVDDRLYGGGPGMLMKVQPVKEAIKAARSVAGKSVCVIYLSPQGKKLNQSGVQELANFGKLILLCGRYEGIDDRLIQTEVDRECSVGDYILSGGELPAMTVIDSVSRLIPGSLGNPSSVSEESFSNGLIECPHYTRPEIYEGLKVPHILLSGHHEAIRIWRLRQSLGRTWLRRPELIESINLDEEQKKLLFEFKLNELKKLYLE
jgi:tRNA (guanine37-N1)-methyltransferase